MLAFIRDTIKQLKREYGTPLIVGKQTILEQNVETGKISNETVELKIDRAIRLANQMSLDFLKSINSTKIGGVASGKFTLIIDRDDIPKDFPILTIDYAEYSQKRLEIQAFDDYQYAVILHVNELMGAERVGIKKVLIDVIGFSENVTRS